MKYVFGYFTSILVFSLIYFVAIFYVQFDAVVKNINYVLLAKEAIVASLKLHILILPIIFLTTKRKIKYHFYLMFFYNLHTKNYSPYTASKFAILYQLD